MNNEYSMLQQIDLFGKSFELYFNRQRYLKTSFGGLMSIMVISLIAVSIWVLGKEVILKNNPFIMNRTLSSWNRTNLTLDVSLGFTVESQSGVYMDGYDRYLMLEAVLSNVTYSYDTSVIKLDQPIRMQNCKREQFSAASDIQFEFYNLNLSRCLDQRKSIEVGGFQDNFYNKHLIVSLKRCNNSTYSNQCASSDEIDEFISENVVQFVVYFQQLNVNYKDFNDPVSFFITEYFTYINKDKVTRTSFFIQEYQIITDGGLIYPSETENTYQRVDYYYSNDIKFFNNSDEHPFVEYVFYTSENKTINYRSYYKIQDILAQLGGLLKTLIVSFDIAFMTIYNRKMLETVITTLFNIKYDDFDKGIQRKTWRSSSVKTPYRNRFKSLKDMESNPAFCKIYNNIDKSTSEKRVPETIEKRLTEKENNREECLQGDLQIFQSNLKKEYFTAKDPIQALESMINHKNEEKMAQETHPRFKSFEISVGEHALSHYLPCLSSQKLKKKVQIFSMLREHVLEFIDILRYSKTELEFEKLKFVLFDKEQLALFNLLAKPENPLKLKYTKNLSDLYNYTLSEETQLDFARTYTNRSRNLDNVDKKLLTLLV